MGGDDAKTDGPATPEAAPQEAAAPETVYTQTELDARVAAAADEARDRHLRLAAEYENFRRRVAREKEQWSNEAIERFVADLLPVLDDFDRALAVGRGEDDPVAAGIRLTEKALRSALARHGVECIDPAGAKFDPNVHEAIQKAPKGDAAAGTVLAVFEKGYTLKGRLLRPARVQVAGD